MVLSQYQVDVLKQGSIQLIKELLRNFPNLCQDHVEPSMDMPMHIVLAERRPSDILLFIFNAFRGCVRVPNVHGQLPLHKAVSWSSLCQATAATTTVTGVDNNYSSNNTNNSAIIRELVREDPTTIATSDWTRPGLTPLHAALLTHGCCSEDIIHTLVVTNPDACKIPTVIGKHLPLHVCAFASAPAAKLAIFGILILAYPDALEIPDDRGFKPVHLCMLCAGEKDRPSSSSKNHKRLYEMLGGDNRAMAWPWVPSET